MKSKIMEIPAAYYDQQDSDNLCFLCEDPDYTLKYRITHFDFPIEFKTCHCGIVKQTPMPNEQFFEWFFNSEVFFSSQKTNKDYIWGYYDYFKDESSRLATSKRRIRKLQSVFEKGKPLNIMKVGPATGTFLHVAQEAGHHVLGCDISNRFVEYAREHYQVKIDVGRFERMPYRDGQFDVLLLFNVIENIPNQDEFFQAVHKKLKKGGRFIFNFVDEKNNLISRLQGPKYFLYRPPICYIYTYAVIEKIMEKYGFRIVANLPDVRYMHPEKVLTLLNWKWALPVVRTLGLAHVNLRLYAYPSRIIVAERI